jgi:hypothetical protein
MDYLSNLKWKQKKTEDLRLKIMKIIDTFYMISQGLDNNNYKNEIIINQ